MTKVGFVVTSLNSGGVENFLLRFLAYNKGSIEPVIICRLGINGELSNQFKALGVRLLKIQIGYVNLLAWIKLYKVLKSENIETVCDFTGNFAGIPMLVGYLAKTRNRIAYYVGATNHFKEDIFRLTYNMIMNRLVFRFSTDILSNSKSALEFFFPNHVQSHPMRFSLIYNGINVAEFLNSSKSLRKEFEIPLGAYVCGHVGRYNSAKNHKTAIEVAIDLCKKWEDFYFIFCGKNVDKELVGRVQLEGLQGRILLLGVRNDVSSVLSTLDAFYFPSITEGQPNALIEAMISDLPFVASNIAPIKEMVPKANHKQLIDPLDKNKAIEKLIVLRESENIEKWKCTDWAKHYFNSELRFGEFMKKLEG